MCILATDGGDKILSGFSALYAHSSKAQEKKTKEHLESLCFMCLVNLRLEKLEMWSMRIKAAVYIYMLHIHAAHTCCNEWEKYLPSGKVIDGKCLCSEPAIK